MDIRFETQPDRRLLGAALRRAFRRDLLPYRLLGPLLVVLTPLTLIIGQPVLAVLCGSLAVVCFAMPSIFERVSVTANWKTYGAPITWRFTEEGLGMSSPLMEGLVRWPAIETVEPMSAQLIFKIDRRLVIPVAIGELPAQQQRELFAFLRGRGLLEPGATSDPETERSAAR